MARSRREPLFHDSAYERPTRLALVPDRPLGARAGSALWAAVAASSVVGALAWLEARELFQWPLGRGSARLLAYGALLFAAVVAQLVQRRQRTMVLTALFAALVPAILGATGMLVLGYALSVVLLARSRRWLALRITAALALWLAYPFACWTVLRDEAASGELRAVLVVWVGLAYSAIYVLVEHRRAAPGRFDGWDAMLYLVALPRLVMPFFQPISPALVAGSSGDMDRRRSARAVGLGLYAAALLAVVSLSHQLPKWHDRTLQFAREFIVYYAAAASHIFVAVAAFRCLGMGLPSGFRWPFLSRSFAEFFRTWNHYVRDAILSLFYFPLVGLLRRRLPRRVTEIVAAYLAIFIGAFVLNDVLAPVVTSPDPIAAFSRAANAKHFGVLLVFWSAIILPRVLWRRGREPAESGWRRWVATATFLVSYLVIWRLAWGASGR